MKVEVSLEWTEVERLRVIHEITRWPAVVGQPLNAQETDLVFRLATLPAGSLNGHREDFSQYIELK